MRMPRLAGGPTWLLPNNSGMPAPLRGVKPGRGRASVLASAHNFSTPTGRACRSSRRPLSTSLGRRRAPAHASRKPLDTTPVFLSKLVTTSAAAALFLKYGSLVEPVAAIPSHPSQLLAALLVLSPPLVYTIILARRS